MKRWLSRRKWKRSMQECERMAKVYYEWRTNQDMERRVLLARWTRKTGPGRMRRPVEAEGSADSLVITNRDRMRASSCQKRQRGRERSATGSQDDCEDNAG